MDSKPPGTGRNDPLPLERQAATRPSPSRFTVVISSATVDLSEHRREVMNACLELGHLPRMMEHLPAADASAIEESLTLVDEADVYVGIFGHRYGSITEMEYRRAKERGVPRLIFFMHEDHPIKAGDVEVGDGTGRLARLKEEIKSERAVAFFESPQDLRGHALQALVALEKRRSSGVGQIAIGEGTRDFQAASLAGPPERIALSRLPMTGGLVLGRDAELDHLDSAWGNSKTGVISLVAWGGVGKSALVNAWLRRIAEHHYRGAIRVYGWSFFSQGSEGHVASGDDFISDALAWFGESRVPDSAWERGRRLAELVRSRRSLLIIDGLEPLQYPPGPRAGEIRDPAVHTLIRELAAFNPGLCLITTRHPVTELEDFEQPQVEQVEVDNLSSEASVRLLEELGAIGSHAELEAAATELGGHALALTLLGTYIRDVHGGQIALRDRAALLSSDSRPGRHAQGVLRSYEKWLADSRHLTVLYLVGLFDRPAPPHPLRFLCSESPVAGFTDQLGSPDDGVFRQLVADLVRVGLLFETPAEGGLDAHPLVREYFAASFKRRKPELWSECHSRLFDYLSSTAPERPATLSDMMPLYLAIGHGCHAMRYQEAFDVYETRISQGDKIFSLKKLGAYSTDLVALAGFFDQAWSQPVEALAPEDRAWLLNMAGFELRAVGRLSEALEPVRIVLQADLDREDWHEAAIGAGNLAEIHLILGNIDDSVRYSTQSVDLADRSGNRSEQIYDRAILGEALHRSGSATAAHEMFSKAEAMQYESIPDRPHLDSVHGFWFCEFLLSQVETARSSDDTAAWSILRKVATSRESSPVARTQEERSAVCRQLRVRGSRIVSRGEGDGNSMLLVGLGKLVIGAARLVEALGTEHPESTSAEPSLTEAVKVLWAVDHQVPSVGRQVMQSAPPRGEFLARGLLWLARFHFETGDLARSRSSLSEALRIARRDGMRIIEIEAELLEAQLLFREGELTRARSTLDRCRALVEVCNYGHRRSAIEQLYEHLGP